MTQLSSLQQAFSDFLSDPSNFPPEFKAWITLWIEAYPPVLPLSQISGYAVSTAYVIQQTPGAITSGTAETAVTWTGTPIKDAQAMFSSGANTRLTCKQAGAYQVSAFIDWGTNSTGERVIWLRKNGTTHIGGDDATTANAQGNPQNATALVYLAVGDYVETTAIQNSGGSITPAGFFTAVRVSA